MNAQTLRKTALTLAIGVASVGALAQVTVGGAPMFPARTSSTTP